MAGAVSHSLHLLKHLSYRLCRARYSCPHRVLPLAESCYQIPKRLNAAHIMKPYNHDNAVLTLNSYLLPTRSLSRSSEAFLTTHSPRQPFCGGLAGIS